MAKSAVNVSSLPVDPAPETRRPVADREVFDAASAEAALDHAVSELLDTSRRAGEAAARRGDEIDAILSEIQAARAELSCADKPAR